MSSFGIITGLLIAVTLSAGRLHAQAPTVPKTNKAVVYAPLSVSCADSSSSQLLLNGRHPLSHVSAAWKNASLLLRFEGKIADGATYILEAVVAPDLALETRLSAIDKEGHLLSIFPVDHLLVLDHAPGKQSRALSGRLSFRGIAEEGLPLPTTMQYVVVGEFCIRPR